MTFCHGNSGSCNSIIDLTSGERQCAHTVHEVTLCSLSTSNFGHHINCRAFCNSAMPWCAKKPEAPDMHSIYKSMS